MLNLLLVAVAIIIIGMALNSGIRNLTDVMAAKIEEEESQKSRPYADFWYEAQEKKRKEEERQRYFDNLNKQ